MDLQRANSGSASPQATDQHLRFAYIPCTMGSRRYSYRQACELTRLRSASGIPGVAGSAGPLRDRRSVRNLLLRSQQNHIAFLRYAAEDEHFREEAGNPSGREVHDSGNLPADQLFRSVTFGDLRTGGLDAEFPKSICSLIAGLRASGKGSADRMVPMRMSSFKKSSIVAMYPPPVVDKLLLTGNKLLEKLFHAQGLF